LKKSDIQCNFQQEKQKTFAIIEEIQKAPTDGIALSIKNQPAGSALFITRTPVSTCPIFLKRENSKIHITWNNRDLFNKIDYKNINKS